MIKKTLILCYLVNPFKNRYYCVPIGDKVQHQVNNISSD